MKLNPNLAPKVLTKGKLLRPSLTLSALALLLSGCTSFYGAHQSHIDDVVAKDAQSSKTLQAAMTGRNTVLPKSGEQFNDHAANSGPQSAAGVQLVRRVPDIWIGKGSTSVDKTVGLPAEFSKKFTLVSKSPLTMHNVAQLIKNATGLKVFVSPEMLSGGGESGRNAALGQAQMMPNREEEDGRASVNVMSTTSSANAMAGADGNRLNYRGSLSQVLDAIAGQFGGYWEWRDDTIVLYRIATKSFTLKSNPGDTIFSTSLGRESEAKAGSTSSSTTGGGRFNATTTNEMKVGFSAWADIEGQIKAVLSPNGKYHISQSTGTVTVTDNKGNVDEVERLIERENAILTRQIAFRVEILSVTTDNNKGYGVDWSAVYSKLATLDPGLSINFLSPTNLLTDGTNGNLSVTLLGGSNQNKMVNRFGGSKAMLDLLNEVGRASIVTTASTTTLNRKAVPVAVTKQVSYLAQTTPGVSTVSGGSSTPGLTPGTVTTGFILSLLPTVYVNNKVMLQFWLDVSTLENLVSVTSGEGSSQQTIQTPEISSFQSAQNVGLNLGDTLILSGFERSTHQYDKRTLTENSTVALGGSYKGEEKIESIVIMITPTLIGGI